MELQVFKNSEFGELKILEVNGKMCFPATNCARVLGYQNPQKAIRDHCKGVNEMVTPTKGGNQIIKYIPEGDLYRLIVNSKLPSAEKFERWVFDEVLPNIRKNGSYGNIQAEGINQDTIKHIIETTVSTTIVALMKEIVPMIKDLAKNEVEVSQLEIKEEQDLSEINFNYSRYKMENFPKAVLNRVDDMLIEMSLFENINYSRIARFCTVKGYPISSPSVKRYYEICLRGRYEKV